MLLYRWEKLMSNIGLSKNLDTYSALINAYCIFRPIMNTHSGST